MSLQRQEEQQIRVERVLPDGFEDAQELIEEYCATYQVVMRDEPGELKQYIEGPRSAVWVARSGTIPAGCILYRPLPQLRQAAEMKRLYVRPAFRRRGVADKLLDEVEAFAAIQQVTALYLDTNEDFSEALAFYKGRGYAECERYNGNPQATIFLRKALAGSASMRTFEAGDEEAFRKLNEAWIAEYFRLEAKDLTTLRDPRKYILGPGGQIFMALRDGQQIGCCALMLNERGIFEIAKMAVADSEQGRGVGRRLLEYAIEYAWMHGIERLYLETNSKLKNAIHLYESVGFRHLPRERVVPSPYQRVDVYMEMTRGETYGR